MTTMNLSLTSRRHLRPSRWSHFRRNIAEWHRRTHSRQELIGLGNAGWRDLGLSRCDAEFEASKPFWQA